MSARNGFTILLVEDNDNDALLFKDAVERSIDDSGMVVHFERVSDGVEAIDYFSGKDRFGDRRMHPFPDIVVLDLKMPRLSGLDVLRWLKEHPQYRRIPKILLSGSADEHDIDDAYLLGANTYFQKPFDPLEFREMVNHLICYWSHTQAATVRNMRSQ